MKKMFAAFGLLCAMSACGSSNDLPLEGTYWKLESMPGIPAEEIASSEDAFTIEFDAAETLVAGRTNCNRFFGPYELKGRELEFENLGMTRMACPGMEYEDYFVKMLDEVDRYKIEGSQLQLLDDGRVLATFRAAAKPAQE